MAGATRARQQSKIKISSPQGDEPSSGTTIVDETMAMNNYAPSSCNENLSIRNSQAESITTDDVDPLGEHVKEAIAMISKLEGLGLQRLKIPLPKCVVLGEQSTGKSSVIEAISGIKTPRDTDTCTRCPLFIKLEPSNDPDAPWGARVTLRRQYAFDRDPKAGRGTARRFPGWVPCQPTEVEFATTDSPTQLEEIIRRAQLATLSPLVEDSTLFLRLSDPDSALEDYHRTQFSPNIVVISITKPGLPAALSFYDLPGIIGQSETTEGQFLVKFVRDLVSEYIEDPDSLILLTYSLENDIANSTAGALSLEHRATDRCIGILTKPDRLPAGTREDKLRDVFEGRRFALGHGYFVVKNLDQDAINLGLSHRDARLQERRFFETHWSSFRAYRDRFGTSNLQAYLSKKLAEQVIRTLPNIHAQIDARLSQVEEQLASIPEPPKANAVRLISDEVFRFSEDVRKEMLAEHPCRDWYNRWQTLEKAFMQGLAAMKPTMLTVGEKDKGIFASSISKDSDDVIVIDDDDDGDGELAPPATPSKKRKAEDTPTPSKRPVQQSVPSADGDSYRELRKLFKLDDVSHHLYERSSSKIPGQIEPKVIYDIILTTMEHWHLPMDEFFKQLESQLRGLVLKIFRRHSHFGKWKDCKLYDLALSIVERALKINMDAQRDTMAAESLSDERDGPFIYHQEIFESDMLETREAYSKARYQARSKLYLREQCQHIGRPLSNAEIDRFKKESEKKDSETKVLISREPYKTELDIIAQVTTYYMLAARRLHDSVCIRIESKFFKQLQNKLREDLESDLEIFDEQNGPQYAIDLLDDPPYRRDKRNELRAMKDALLQGQQCLRELEEKYGVGSNIRGMNGSQSTWSTQDSASTLFSEDMIDFGHNGRFHN